MESKTSYSLEQEDSGFKFIVHATQKEPEKTRCGSIPATCEVHLTVLRNDTLVEQHFFLTWPAMPQALDILAGWAMWRMGAYYLGTRAQVLREDESKPSPHRGAEYLQLDGEQPVAVASINLPWKGGAYALAWYTLSPTVGRMACWEINIPFDKRTPVARKTLCYKEDIPVEKGSPCFDALHEALKEAVRHVELCELDDMWQDLVQRFLTLLSDLYPTTG